MFLLSCPEFPEVELQLLALKDIPISATRLPGSACDGCVKTTSSELCLQQGVNLGIFLPLVQATLCVVRQLFGLSVGGPRSWCLAFALLRDWLRVMRFVPLAERGSIDLDDGTLDEGIRTNKLVIGGIVNDANYPRLLGNMFRSPCKIARVKAKCTIFNIPPTHTDGVNALDAEFGVGGLTAELELSLLAIMSTLGTRLRAFVPR